jgi:E3 ubiquitin-protein ligase UBR7
MADNAEVPLNDSATVEGEDNVVNLQDYLKDQEEQEANTIAVLGASDETTCTYPKGYVKRQALYSCLDCNPESRTDESKRAGVCLACSLECHTGHEMVELYTKRNFKCDCGVAGKFATKCTFEQDFRKEANKLNEYNQNFSGLYCVCHRPYPDPEDTVADEMIQCVVCEDWFHTRHLNSTLPMKKNFGEMICDTCMVKNEFLKAYTQYCIDGDQPDEEVAVVDEQVPAGGEKKDEKIREEIDQCVLDIINVKMAETGGDGEAGPSGSGASKQKAPKSEEALDAKRQKLDADACRKPQSATAYTGGATFWPENWRQHLCQCDACLNVYRENKVLFIIDLDDTIHSYEEKGIVKQQEREDKFYTDVICKLDRVAQVELIHEYNNMKDKLKGKFK